MVLMARTAPMASMEQLVRWVRLAHKEQLARLVQQVLPAQQERQARPDLKAFRD
jgi:hypothetical protein